MAKTLEEQVNQAFEHARQARTMLLKLSRTDTSRWESSMFYSHQRDINQWQDELSAAEEEIERLKLVIQARMVEPKPS